MPKGNEKINTGKYSGYSFAEFCDHPNTNKYGVSVIRRAMGQEVLGGPLGADLYRLGWHLIILMAQGEWSVEDDDADSSMSAGSKGFSVLMMNKSEDGPDAYAARRSDPPGVAVLDTACQMTMHGTPWRLKYEQALHERHLKTSAESQNTTFHGVGGSTKSDTVFTLPAGIGKAPFALGSAELDQDAPLLISRDTQAKLGTKIDVPNKTADFATLGIYNYPLIDTAGGHLGVNLLDFEDANVFDDEFQKYSDKDGPFKNGFDTDVIDAAEVIDVFHAEKSYQAEIEEVFEDPKMIDWSEDPAMRMASSRRSKKVLAMPEDLKTTEARTYDVMTGTATRTRRIPRGKTLLKQLFGGQFGLTMLAALHYGYNCGQPLDIEDGWDGTTRAGKQLARRQLLEEDPYVTVITMPCGPWGDWGRCNIAKGGVSAATVYEAQEATRPLLALADQVVVDRVRRGRTDGGGDGGAESQPRAGAGERNAIPGP